MRRAFYASAIALLGLGAAGSVQAMTVAPLSTSAPGLTLVAEGCGPGWYRGPHGHCHPAGHPMVAHPHCWWRNGVRVCN
jgi:hypothetical protein